MPPSAPMESDPRGVGRLRRQVGVLRTLTVVSLVLLVLVAVWSFVGIGYLTSQMSSLEAKVDALSARLVAQGTSPAVSPSAGVAAPEASASPALTTDPAVADVVAPAGIGASGAILVGDPEAKKFVDVYVDYQCPYCQRWEVEIGTALMERALQLGSGLAVRQYNMAFLGEANRSLNPPGASARAANAAACVLDGGGPEAFTAFNAAIFAAPGGADAATRFDAASLVALAGSQGASDATLACIEDERYVPFVAATTQAAFARGVTGTPTVLVNGKPLQDSFGDPQLLALLQM